MLVDIDDTDCIKYLKRHQAKHPKRERASLLRAASPGWEGEGAKETESKRWASKRVSADAGKDYFQSSSYKKPRIVSFVR